MLVDVKLEKARQSLLDAIVPLPEEAVALEQALGRIMVRDLVAPLDLPSHPQSAVDGYALGRDGLNGPMECVLRQYPGETPAGRVLGPGEAVAVVTGGTLPPGTGAVIAREYVRVEGNRILARMDIPPGRNVKPAGEDFRAGQLVMPAGSSVDPGLIAVLAAFGQVEVYVRRRPRVGILSLGEEIVSCRTTPLPDQVRDANGPLLAALVTLHGGEVVGVETAGDSGPLAARVRLERLLEQADLVLTVGGAASGPDDYALSMLRETGARVLFWGVRIKPGHHTGAALCADRPVIALSGNPAACAVAYQLLAAPVLRACQGLRPCPPERSAVCTDSYPKQGGPRRFLRGYASCGQDGWRVSLLPGQKSSMLRSLINWNVLVELPAGHPPVEAGTRVAVIPLSG
ncbi:MAG TPA: molybdopterin molybdotransferase MoeA [Spirochaetia bacterium]|nr:molybdopterin molybdotransferase MoeA [Spirochaetia bacterium]